MAMDYKQHCSKATLVLLKYYWSTAQMPMLRDIGTPMLSKQHGPKDQERLWI